MKKMLLRGLSGSLCLLLFVGGLLSVCHLTERKSSYDKYQPFYQQKENFDVLFFGSSHVLNAIFPLEMWDDYGIVSYNFGGHATTMATAYWQMVNAFEYTTPEVVVIDCLFAYDDLKIDGADELVHLSMDSIPLSRNKILAVKDLFEDENDRMEFLFPFSIYHNRWSELSSEDFSPTLNKEKGAESRIAVAVPDECASIEKSDKLTDDTIGIEYLEKMIEFCQEKDVEVLLTFIPFPALEWHLRIDNRVSDIAEEYGVAYLDFETLVKQIDFNTDCYDSFSHLNPSGGKKISGYIANFIKEHYDVADHRGDSVYSDWNDSYSEYVAYKLDNLRQQEALKPFLMLLYDEDISYSIYIEENSVLCEDEVLQKLLLNTGITASEMTGECPRLITVDGISHQVITVTPGEEKETSFGSLSLEREGKWKLLKNKEEVATVLFDGQTVVIVYDNRTKMPVMINSFLYTGDEYEKMDE